jgi:hypothetical protein
MTATQSSKNTKWIWIGLGGAILACLCAVGLVILTFARLGQQVKDGMKTDPEEAAAVAHNIADYELPEGYREDVAADIVLYEVVMIEHEDHPGAPTIVLAQFGSMSDPQQMEQQIRQSFGKQAGTRDIPMSLVDVQTRTIRGEEVDVYIYEGTDDRGSIMRQLITTFPGKNGTAMLMIVGFVDEWDEDGIDSFLDSIK